MSKGTKERIAASASPPRNDKGSKEPVRYQHWYCDSCQRKLGGLGYILTETGRAPAWHSCGLCGKTALITPTDLYKPAMKTRRRTGAGERERASRG